MEHGCPSDSLVTSDNLVSWPSAANMAAQACSLAARPLRFLCDIFRDVFHLASPAFLIHSECLGAAVCGNPVKAGLRDGQQRTAWYFLKFEFHQRRRFV